MCEMIHDDRLVKIRKPHQCHYCCRRIEKGKMYLSTHRNSDGVYDLYKCVDCQDFFETAENDIIEEILYDGVFEEGCIEFYLEEQGFTIDTQAEFFDSLEAGGVKMKLTNLKKCQKCGETLSDEDITMQIGEKLMVISVECDCGMSAEGQVLVAEFEIYKEGEK